VPNLCGVTGWSVDRVSATASMQDVVASDEPKTAIVSVAHAGWSKGTF